MTAQLKRRRETALPSAGQYAKMEEYCIAASFVLREGAMPADLVKHSEIPDLAKGVTPAMLDVLRQLQQNGFILNNRELPPEMVAVLGELARIGLADPGYEGNTNQRQPYLWARNGNGSRVLRYLTGIRSGPYYEVASADLASWLEEQGPERWWNVDGDPLLTGRMTFPCPAALLAKELRRISRPLIVQAKKDDDEARGQLIGKGNLDRVVTSLSECLHQIRPVPTPAWAADRTLYLCWVDSLFDWMLSEDSRMTQIRAAEEAHARDKACMKKE